MTAPLSVEGPEYRRMNSPETAPPKRLRRLSASSRSKCWRESSVSPAQCVRKAPADIRGSGTGSPKTASEPSDGPAPDSALVRRGNPGMHAEPAKGVHQPLAGESQDDHADRDERCPKDGEEHVTSP